MVVTMMGCNSIGGGPMAVGEQVVMIWIVARASSSRNLIDDAWVQWKNSFTGFMTFAPVEIDSAPRILRTWDASVCMGGCAQNIFGNRSTAQ
jgi:hypothetical protein